MFKILSALACLNLTVVLASPITDKCADIPIQQAAGSWGDHSHIPGCGDSTNTNARIDNVVVQQPDVVQSVPATQSSPIVNGQSLSNDQSLTNGDSLSTSNSSSLNTTNEGGGGVVDQGGAGALDQVDSTAALTEKITASMTRYGQGPPGTGGTDKHCQGNPGSCGNNPVAGYTAAASEFWYFHGAQGVGSKGNTGGGSGGLACGTCWRIWGGTDGDNKFIPFTSIVVLITNECAAGVDPDGRPNNCGMTSYEQQNRMDSTMNVDLCMDSGATQAFWGDPAWGTTHGAAQQVDCKSEWCGTFASGEKSGPKDCVTIPANYPRTT